MITDDSEPLQTGPFGAMYRCFEELQRRLTEVERQIRSVTDNPGFYRSTAQSVSVEQSRADLTTILDDCLHQRAEEIRSRTTPKSAAFTQTMFPISIATTHDGNYYPPSCSKISFKGLVTTGPSGARPAVSSELTLELDAVAPLAQQLGDAVRGKKKYKLTLEETEETF